MTNQTEPTAKGKVRDIYDLGDRLLLVATDRISAYDVVLPTDIPNKGQVLTALSLFWFSRTQGLIPNHLISSRVKDFPDVGLERAYLDGRTLLVKKAEVIPVECIVRGYLSGSAWIEYREKGTVCDQLLPDGLIQSQQLPQTLFTPSTKAVEGHDENISIAEMENLVGPDLTRKLKQASLNIYSFAASFAQGRGIIIADTKFEFGLVDDQVILIDEVLTPDSSRFWPLNGYRPGISQPSFDKQFVRDWLDRSGWDHTPPGPELPPEIIGNTTAKYIEAYEKITGQKWAMEEKLVD